MYAIVILTILAAVGATLIVTKSWLFEKVRENRKTEFASILFHCPQCFGFWCAFVFSCFVAPLFVMTLYETILFVFGIACTNSGICEILEHKIYEQD